MGKIFPSSAGATERRQLIPAAATMTVDENSSKGSSDVPPPLPPRPVNQVSYGVSPYSSPYGMSPYGSSPYGMLGGGYGSPYGSYGGYGGYNSLGGYRTGYNDAGSGSDFVRLAEESSRQAFQSIESIVQAFASVSMMLESTYFAVHSSFRAVLGVAEHFSRLRGHMASLSLIRTLSLYLRKLMHVIGLSSTDPADEDTWRQALASSCENTSTGERSSLTLAESLAQGNVNNRKSSWPIALFFAVVFGTPWLIWKLLTGLTESTNRISGSTSSSLWTKELGPHYVAKSLYTFAASSSTEMSLSPNQRVIVAPKELQPAIRGWLLAFDGKVTGLVPANYIEIIAHKKGDIEAEGNSGEANDVQSRPGLLEEAFASAYATTASASIVEETSTDDDNEAQETLVNSASEKSETTESTT